MTGQAPWASMSDVPNHPWTNSAEAFLRDAALRQCCEKISFWRMVRLGGQLKRTPVMAQRRGCATELESRHRICRIHVLILHEPPRFVGANRQQGEIELRMALGHLTE